MGKLKHSTKVLTLAARKLNIHANAGLDAICSAAAQALGRSVPLQRAHRWQLLHDYVGPEGLLRPRLVSRTEGPKRQDSALPTPPTGQHSGRLDPLSPAFLESYEWRVVRMMALKREGAQCQCCGATRADGIKLHVDHIEPRRKRPDLALDLSNLQVLCEVCNHGKGNWDSTDWREVNGGDVMIRGALRKSKALKGGV